LGGRSEALNWDAVGAIAESVGAVGVIATLLYLAAQIRANTRSVRASTRQETEGGARQLNLALVQDAELSRIWSSGLLDFHSLPREEKIRFGRIASMFLHEFDNSEYQFGQGTLDQPSLDQSRRQLRTMAALPGFATWWGRNEIYTFSAPFEKLVSQLVVEVKEPAA
jgi:hypothetical protein